MKIQIESGKNTIQAAASAWGPFTYDFEPGMPTGRTVASATVTSYLGRVRPADSDILSTFTDTTSELIDSSSMSSDYVLAVYFNRPTTTSYINAKHSLVIEFTLDAAGGGGTHTAFFYAVDVI